MATIKLKNKNDSGLRLRMKYFTESELKDVRPTLLRGFEAIGVKDLVAFVKEEFNMADRLNDMEIEVLFSKDIKIDRIRYARLIGNIEALVEAFIIEVARDTISERKKLKRDERKRQKRREQFRDEVDSVLDTASKE